MKFVTNGTHTQKHDYFIISNTNSHPNGLQRTFDCICELFIGFAKWSMIASKMFKSLSVQYIGHEEVFINMNDWNYLNKFFPNKTKLLIFLFNLNSTNYIQQSLKLNTLIIERIRIRYWTGTIFCKHKRFAVYNFSLFTLNL